jgi:hypothetical protein
LNILQKRTILKFIDGQEALYFEKQPGCDYLDVMMPMVDGLPH